MKIKNEYIRICAGKRKYELKNTILDKYLTMFASSQLDTSSLDNLSKGLAYLFIKFDEPLDYSVSDEVSIYSFDIRARDTANYSQAIDKNTVTVQYDYIDRENFFFTYIVRTDSEDWTEHEEDYENDLTELYERPITAIGFSNSKNSILAVLDTSQYGIYLRQGEQLSITRKDVITSDAVAFESNSPNVTGAVHLAPYGDSKKKTLILGDHSGRFAKLYSIGLGQNKTVMLEEYIVGTDVTATVNSNVVEISSISNAETEMGLYPSYQIYPGTELFPHTAKMNWVIFKYKIYARVRHHVNPLYGSDYTSLDDTGDYYLQVVPINKFGNLKIKIKYERG